MEELFSKRNGFAIKTHDIVIRYGAPSDMRGYLFLIMQDYGYGYKKLRDVVCRATMQSPDPNNWGENDFMKNEIDNLIQSCDWPLVYDLIETFYSKIKDSERKRFSNEINAYFLANGIGWKFENGKIEYRGDDLFEDSLQQAKDHLLLKNMPVSSRELKEAIHDLGKRPNADITGAVQHSLAALECVCREITREKDTLGSLINKHPYIVPKPLDEVISKIWGYASNNGRHLKEGNAPNFAETELLVHLSASICLYLSKKIQR